MSGVEEDRALVSRALGALGAGGSRLRLVRRNGRWLLVLPGNRAVAARTLRLYQPQRARARALAGVLAGMVAAGLDRLLLPVVPAAPQGRPLIAGLRSQPGLLLGSPDHASRRVIACYRAGAGWEVAKLAFGEQGTDVLERESAVLRSISGRVPGAPGWIGFHRTGDLAILRMPWIDGRPLAGSESGYALDLLTAWASGRPVRMMTEFPEWPAIERALTGLPGGGEALRMLAGHTVRAALRHGDFARWNLLRTSDGRTVVIDWEWSESEGLGGLDLVHFHGQDARLVRRLPGERAVSAIIARLDEPACSSYLEGLGWGTDRLPPVLACLAFKQGAGHQDNREALEACLARWLESQGTR